jgi:2-phospho-L-lactate guanylyltransferase (CobY/MobA/RfbA family)
MARYVIPFRVGGKTRLGDPQLAQAMLRDVVSAISALGAEPLVADGPGGQGRALAAVLEGISGPVTIVNGDLPCVTTAELEELTRSAPAVGAARDGTTNALSLRDSSDFAPLYGPGSAARFAAQLGARSLVLPGLQDDVDTWEDLDRVAERVGPQTRGYLGTLARV